MGTFLIAFVALTVAYSLLWHNRSPHTEHEDEPDAQNQATRRTPSKPQVSHVPTGTSAPSTSNRDL